MHSDKAALRKQMRALRGRLGPEALQAAGTAVAIRVSRLLTLLRAQRVMCYVSVRREVPTRALIGLLPESGIQVAIPRIVGPGQMEARDYLEPLVDGAWGIPTSDGPPMRGADACICPGLAFDRTGSRLGYGGGFYDAWLGPRRCVPIGICVDEALIEHVPRQPHDVPMAYVVTPTQTLKMPTPVRVVAGAWVREGRVLAARRGPGKARAGRWELPGGKVEAGESDHVALERELHEELGATVRAVGSPLGQVHHDYGDIYIQLVLYRVEDVAAEEPEAREHDQLRWLGAGELSDVAWGPADQELLEALHAHLEARHE